MGPDGADGTEAYSPIVLPLLLPLLLPLPTELTADWRSTALCSVE